MLVHPAIAESCASAIDGVVSDPDVAGRVAAAAVGGPELLRRFAGICDGRSDQGRDHPVAVVLTLCAAAVLAGMRSFTAIAGWVADVPAELLAWLYRTPTPEAPSKTTRWRVLTGVQAAAVDAAIGSWLAEQARRTHCSEPPADGRSQPDMVGPTQDRPLTGFTLVRGRFGLVWQVLDSNQRRRCRRFYREAPDQLWQASDQPQQCLVGRGKANLRTYSAQSWRAAV